MSMSRKRDISRDSPKPHNSNSSYIHKLINNIEAVLESLYGSEADQQVDVSALRKESISLVNEGDLILKSLNISFDSTADLNTSKTSHKSNASVKTITRLLCKMRKSLIAADKRIGTMRRGSIETREQIQNIE